MQLTRFEDENTKPYCFDWSVNEDGKQLAFSDQNNSYALHDQRNCDGYANSDHSEPNDKNSSGDGVKELQDTGSMGSNRTRANCESVRTNGESLSSVESDDKLLREAGVCVDDGKSGSRHPSRLSNLSVATSNSDAPSSGGEPTSDSALTDTPSLGTSDSALTNARSFSSVTSAVPTSNQCDAAQTDSDVAEFKKAPTEVMSPRSYDVFKSGLIHTPEMNLPWESMRKTAKCGCGVTFSYSVRKVRVWSEIWCVVSGPLSVVPLCRVLYQ